MYLCCLIFVLLNKGKNEDMQLHFCLYKSHFKQIRMFGSPSSCCDSSEQLRPILPQISSKETNPFKSSSMHLLLPDG